MRRYLCNFAKMLSLLIGSLCVWSGIILGDVRAETPFPEIIVDADQPSDPWMKEIADLDNDGKLDLIVCGRAGPVVWYKNPSWSKVTINTEIGSAGSTTGIESGDIDGDGDVDVALANGYWYENPLPDGDPSNGNWTRRQIGSISTAHDIYFGDLDGDGDLDAVKRNQGSGGTPVRILRQDSPTSWTEKQLAAFTGEGITLGDLDGDSDLDIIIGSYWYENTGDIIDGAWTRRQYTTSYTLVHTVVKVGDINKDGFLDVILSPAEYAGNTSRLSWFEGKSDPTIGMLTEHIVANNIEAVVHGLQVADVNNDGQLDIIFAEMHQGQNPDEVGVYINGGNGTSWTKEVKSENGSHNIQAADIDGDGDIDFFGANWNNEVDDRVKLWWNDSDPSFALDQWQRHVVDADKPWLAVFITSGDINGDGLNDIITGGWWYENPGSASGAWTRHTIGSPLNNMAAVYDFDSDGDLDVLGTEGQGSASNSSFSWAQNDGSGGFTVLSNVSNGDGDFLQGVAVDSFSSGTRSVALSWHIAGKGIQLLDVPSDPANTTWQWQQISNISQDEDLSSGDIDGDGDMDLLLGTRWLQNNNGDWSEFTVNGVSGNPDRNELADINGDGLLDAVVGFEAISTSGKLAWYEQPSSATGTWAERVIANVIGPMSVDVADMDHDGDPDVVVGEHNLANPSSARVYVFENTGGGAGWNQYTVYTGDEHHDGTQLVDIDNDGDLDIISIGWSHGRVVLYENRAIISGMPTVATPLITPNGGVYSGPVQVTMSASTIDATIRYTTDGSNPTMSSTLYTEPFTLSQTTTIKACGFKSGYTDSTIRTATFTITIDTQAPSLISVNSIGNPNAVTVVFDELVTADTAENIYNYNISNGISISAATLGADGRTVTLLIETLSEPVDYTLTASSISDLSANISGELEYTFQFTPIDVSAGLVGYWSFEEGSGTTTADVSGNGNAGTLQSGPIWTNGQFGGGIDFDGQDDYVSLPNMDVSGSALTISAWIRSDNLANCGSYNDCRVISKATGTDEGEHYWMLSTIKSGSATRLRFRLKTGSTTTTLVASLGDIADNNWVHAVAVYDGSQMRLYKDAVQVGSISKSGALATDASIGVNIGRNPDGYGEWDGVIDEVRVYNQALDEAEIQSLFDGNPTDPNGSPKAPKNFRIVN